MADADVVLAVDLDGTLTPADTLHELALQLLRERPLDIFALPFWLMKGRASLKQRIAQRIQPNPVSLPYNKTLLTWLTAEHAAGRKLALCTASDEQVAQAIAGHLGIFDEVIASDGKSNLAGARKREALEQRYGIKGYDYAGNSKADLTVWEGARHAIVVNASAEIEREAARRATVTKTVPREAITFTTVRRMLRIHQWVKNLLLGVPLLAAHQFQDSGSIMSLVLAFVAFSFCASAVYIGNDLLDLESDRRHARKRLRPFAAAVVPIPYGLVIAPLLLAASFSLALFVAPAFAGWLGVYFTMTCAYSLVLKRIALVDSLLLAGLYTLRIVAGGAAVGVTVSFWLLALAIFLFLSLAFVKRFAELTTQAKEGVERIHGRGYAVSDAPLVQSMGVASGYLSVLVLALYLNSEAVAQLYAYPQLIWFAIPVMLLWVSWVWLKAHRGEMYDDPIVFAIKDKASLAMGAIVAITFIVASLWGAT
ncbi:MAG: UbiA family prenyltransferase [Pseudomonadota bacterium]